MTATITDFRAALSAAGLDFPGDIIPDGRLHRVKVNGDHNPNSWYVLHPDGLPAGSYGCWKRGFSETWCAKASDILNEAERAERDRKWKAQQAEREVDRQRQHDEARAQAQAILDNARPATDDHPYLKRKGVKAHPGVLVGPWPQRQRDNCLLIPLRNPSGSLMTVQAIFPDKPTTGRDKDFLRGGAKQGAYFVIGDPAAAPVIVIAEGYATAATLHEATGYAAVVAVDAGNLRPVAEAIRAIHPGKRILIASDNDRNTEGNPGLSKATAAAQAITAALAIPEFAADESGTDFNDLAALHGIEAVRKAVAEARPAMADIGLAGAVAIPDDDLFSDYGNVIKLLNRLSGRLAYSPGLDWLLYCPDTGVWEPEPCAERVKNLVLETLRAAWSEVLDKAAVKSESIRKQRKELDDDDPGTATLDKRMKYAASDRAKVANWVRQCETAYRIRSTLEIAEGYFWTRPDVWDANPHVLVCNNGVLDLATGHLLPHSPDYRATKTTGTDFIPGARHPAWDAVVALLQAEGDRYTFIHHYCGSGLHGENPNERAVIFQGDGGTGKGTLLTAIHRALGAYAETVEVGTLLATDWRKQNKSAPREDLLKLRGARFVYPSLEPPKDSKIDDASFKALVGNDAIAARYPHARNSITFRPVFKLVIQTNFPLRTEFNDPGMKRRVIVVPFNQKPDRPDPAIKNALINDPTARAACLAWLYEGYRTWRANGFDLPASALAAEATAEYWREMNPFEQFAADVGLTFGKRAKCVKTRLTSAFKSWREESGRTDAMPKEFPHWLKSMGCSEVTENRIRMWWGVQFPQDEDRTRSTPSTQAEIENKVVDFHTSKSIDEFPETDRSDRVDRVRSGNKPPESPADALSSHHGDASKPMDCGNSANGANSGERKPCAAAGIPPVDNLPAGASSDARELWAVLKHYRGAETADRLAQKLGWNTARVVAAAMELRTHGRATVSGAFIGPLHPPADGTGDNKERF